MVVCRELLLYGEQILASAHIDSCKSDALTLLSAAARSDRVGLFTRSRELLTEPVVQKYKSWIARRAKKEPIQYIIGEWEFMGLPFRVSADALIPRPETELLVGCVIGALCRAGKSANYESFTKIRELNAPVRILDLCTGSGCIAVSLAAFIKGSRITATDISAEALRLAKTNAELNGVSDRVDFLRGDMFEPIEDMQDIVDGTFGLACADDASEAVDVSEDYILFDVVCANPPYVSEAEYAALPDDVRLFEPKLALFGGADGCDILYRIAAAARKFLKPGGLMALEVGRGQAARVTGFLSDFGYKSIKRVNDLHNIERVLLARA